MIRRHKLKHDIPKKLINELVSFNKKKLYENMWEQIEGEDYPLLREAVMRSIGKHSIENTQVIYHVFAGSVYPHADMMDKTCYLVPLKITNSMRFFEEHQSIKMDMNHFYTFNDFNEHGITNEYNALGVIASVSKDFYESRFQYGSKSQA